MDERSKFLGAAPWSNQKVSKPVQYLAWVLTVCGIFAVGSIVYFSLKEGVASDNVLIYLGMVVGLIYYLLIFSYVAIKGKAPPGWLPWA
ncbi:MAG: hypothetical protein ACR2QW_10730 [bacterium]